MTDSPPLQPPTLGDVTIDDGFWATRRETNRTVTIDHQYEQLEEAGCLDNFRRVAAGGEGGFEGMWFADTDAYKWIEAASYAHATHPTDERRRRLDEVIDLIVEAQGADGYLDTYFQLEEPTRKWTNLAMMHELYCAGHLIEAATAHHRATGATALLDVATAFADHIDDVFGDDGMHGVPGHEEIELALVDLYRTTDEQRYLDLAEYFIDRRGRNDGRLRWELDHLDEIAGDADVDAGTRAVFLDDGDYDGRYAQDHEPLREQSMVEGHAVRAMYLFSGATDLLLEGAGDDTLADSLERLWTNMTTKRTYVSGGIGSERAHEGFTEDYDLPNETAYAETCAAVGSVFWNDRMARLTGEARFVDVLERALYNGFLAGVSLDGTEFFYENPLASDGDHSRTDWFHCACCPPNVARLLASLEQYVYATASDALFVNLFVGGSAELDVGDGSVQLIQTTDYPWDGTVTVTVEEVTGMDEFAVNVRLPGWCDDPTLSVNGDPVAVDADDGYATVSREWKRNDTVTLSLPMPVETVVSHPDVEANVGRVALRRGPLVYCVEDVDHDCPVESLRVTETDLDPRFDPDLLDGVTALTGSAATSGRQAWDGELYRSIADIDTEATDLRAIPYYAWDNRDPGAMRVWLEVES